MSMREALLAAIADSPDDDTPRLVYADFLDETGDPLDAARAELIRTAIAEYRLPPGGPEKERLFQRCLGLVKQHRLAWFDYIKNPPSIPLRLDRGFASSWFFKADSLFSEGPTLFEREPVTEITMSVEDRQLWRVATFRFPSRLRKLNLWPGEADGGELVTFFESPHLSGLRELWYMGRHGTRAPIAAAVRVLATRPQYAGLRSLTIEAAGVGDAGAEALAVSSTLTGLTTLGLAQCDVGIGGLRAVLGSRVVSGVTTLVLGGNARTAADGEALASALAGSPHLRQLGALELDETAFADRAAERLAAADWPALARLRVLPHHWQHIDRPTGLPTLSPRGVEALCAARFAGVLESLDLGGHPFGDDGAEALARGNRLARLKWLDLMQVGLTAAGLRHLTAAYARQLEHLQLAYNPLGDDGAEVVAAAAWPRMAPVPGADNDELGLYFGRCGIGDRGATALLNSSTIPTDIPTLFLGRGPVSLQVEAALKRKYTKATTSL
jgi:uncharacterized protein (TIGR02996 family)